MKLILERLLTCAADMARIASEALIRATDAARDEVYFEVEQFPWARELERHWPEIRAELDQLLEARSRIPTFQEVSPEQHAVSNDERWRTYFFYVFGTCIDGNCQRCPRTAELLATVPGLGNAMFSVLLPGKYIPEHRGPYKGLLRYHLALRVPESTESCWIDVKGERRHWREGESLIFDDSFVHSAGNDSGAIRVVLFLDFPRPLPPLVATVNRFMIALIGVTAFSRRPIAYLNDSATTNTTTKGALD
ncbi:MAG: aspartyl/asparaginyl beta-hydroxylase domain-containing protein [Gammaproteobacteria bacterium]|nr:aspartyl/asparaginyl beta-hydroxylase domain-containing protein [Gammaproteobacteria bacterium]